MSKRNEALFPKRTTTALLIITVLMLTLLIFPLVNSQNDLRKINEHYIPLSEYSSILIRLSSELDRDLNLAIAIKDNMKSTELEHKILTAGAIATEIKESAPEMFKLGEKVTWNKLFDSYTDVIKHISKKEFTKAKQILASKKYKESHAVINQIISSGTEKLVTNRANLVERRILRNAIVLATLLFVFASWVFLFLRLIALLRTNIKNRNLYQAKIIDSEYKIRSLLRVMSHDLSTPLSVILIKASLKLKRHRESLTEKELKDWNAINQCSETMREIIDHVREMEAIESGKKSLKLVDVNLLNAFDDLKALFSEKLKEKSVAINITSNVEEPVIKADPTSLKQQVISNILSNAIKFSFENKTIDIEIEQKEQSTLLSIRDYGLGMPSELIGKVFDPTAQTTRAGTSGERGTGFGMPLVKTYIEKLNGVISIESKTKDDCPDDHGTTVKMEFPTP